MIPDQPKPYPNPIPSPMNAPVSKKQRLEHREKSADESGVAAELSSRPFAAMSIDDILGQNKEEFVAKMFEDDGGETGISHERLSAAKAKLEEMSLWMIDCQLRLKQEERLRRKAEREGQLRAIYLPQQPNNDTKDKNTSHFTEESATILLDSGFLNAVDIGKLCLLTGKFFFATLNLDPNYVWKRIFEAKFKYNMDHGLASLYASNKFKGMLDCKGYEWMFRNFFLLFDAGMKNMNKAEALSISLKGLQPPPHSVLNCNNIFFILLTENRDDFGFDSVVDARVLDNEKNIERLLSGDHKYEDNILCGESLKRIQGRLDEQAPLVADELQNGEKTLHWENNLKKRFKDSPRNFHGCLQEFMSNNSQDYLVDFILCPTVSVLALRMDTCECTVAYNSRHFLENGNQGIYSSCDDGSDVDLNQSGKELLLRYFLEENDGTDEDLTEDLPLLTMSVVTYFYSTDPNLRIFLTPRMGDNHLSGGEDLYHIFDYGIDWNGF